MEVTPKEKLLYEAVALHNVYPERFKKAGAVVLHYRVMSPPEMGWEPIDDNMPDLPPRPNTRPRAV